VLLTTRLHDLAQDLGAARTGVTSAEPFTDVERQLRERVASGEHAGLGFTFKDPRRATDVRRSFPWAQRLFVAGWAYLPDAGTPDRTEPATTRVARFATEDHYEPLRRILAAVADALDREGFRTAVLIDDDRLVDRAAAVRAGVGWWGKNTLVLAPGVGPWMLLGTVVTNAPLDLDEPMVRDCGTCRACLPACPTGALVAPGILDARLCLAAVLQSPGVIPRALREAVGDRLYGCDDCLDACPPGVRLAESARRRIGRHDVTEVLGLDDAALLDRFTHFYVPKRRAAVLRRNALVVLGNVGTDDHAALLAGYLSHPTSMLRVHAAWALGRVGGPVAAAALPAAMRHERDPAVLEEIGLAIGDGSPMERGLRSGAMDEERKR
jgi:epoxyqueuosine reductase